MRFRQFLQEDAHHASLRPVTDEERAMIKKSQELARVIHDMIGIKSPTVEQVIHFQKELDDFPEFKCLNDIKKELKVFLDAHDDMGKRQEHVSKNMDKIKSSYDEMKKHFMAGTHRDAAPHKEALKKILGKHDAHIDISRRTGHLIKNQFTSQASIFGSTRFMTNLHDSHYQQIHELDTDGPLYTAHDFPFKAMKEEWDHVIYFLTQLKTEGGQVGFDPHDFRKFMRAKNYGGKTYDELMKTTERYLDSNDKSLIPIIVELIDKVPEIKAANEKRKLEITHVWRGVADPVDENNEEMTEEEIIEADRKEKFVATSQDLRSAKNFALRKGHLEQDRRSNVGYLIKYEVSPEAILFDTKVIATVFNESEVLIDATKALAKEVKEV